MSVIAVAVERLDDALAGRRTHGGFIVEHAVNGHDTDMKFTRELFEIDQTVFVFLSHANCFLSGNYTSFFRKSNSAGE